MKVKTNLRAGRIFDDGSYLESCWNVEQFEYPDYTEIRAVCSVPGYAPQMASIEVPSNYWGDIANCDGVLALGGC
jgi:hypothetical protein